MKKFLFTLVLLVLIFPNTVFAKIGVGVGTGKIQVDEKLKPGTIYNLPPLTVLNTGDEPSDYEVNVSYHEKQPELRPPVDWFIFSPQKFHLDPGKAQIVTIKLNLPVRTEPGDYFAYLEGHPLAKTQMGQTSVGIAAAAKLYFTVVPGNIFEGVYFKALSLWKIYSPWPQIILTLLAIVALGTIFKRSFNIQINRKGPDTKNIKEPTDE